MPKDWLHQKYKNHRTQANVRRKGASNADILKSLAFYCLPVWHATYECCSPKDNAGAQQENIYQYFHFSIFFFLRKESQWDQQQQEKIGLGYKSDRRYDQSNTD